jgi:heptosyltransferase-2
MYPYYGENFIHATSQTRGMDRALPYDILQVNKLRCRPCSKIGYSKCPLGHFKCMEKIEVSKVLEAIYERLR